MALPAPLLTCVSVLLLAAAAAALGPPNGTVGTLDFRYPDYIVQPLVACPFEGVFPHPHDCTWYYRCYDRYGLGYFWRAYFQCEPGTHFSDKLDQCVWESDDLTCRTQDPYDLTCTESKEDCRQTDICPITQTGTAVIVSVEICYTSTKICMGQKNEPLCPVGSVYDNSNKRCIEEATLCRPQEVRPLADMICEDQLSRCQDYQVCRLGAQPETLRLCDVKKNCFRKDSFNTSRSLCPERMLFNAFTNLCVPIPQASEACPGGVLVQKDVPCVQETETCAIYESCETRRHFLGCSSYFVCDGMTRSSVCRPGSVFAASLGGCVRSSSVHTRQVSGSVYSPCTNTDGEVMPPEPTPPNPEELPTEPPPQDVNDFIDNYVCQVDQDRPSAVGHRLLHCMDLAVCDGNGLPTNQVRACDGYFECQSPAPRPTLVMCPAEQHFSYEFNMCRDTYMFGQFPCNPVTTSSTTTSTTTTPTTTTTTTTTPTPTTTTTTVPTPEPSDPLPTCQYPGQPFAPLPSERHLYCLTTPYCGPSGDVLGHQTLCSSFYHCDFNYSPLLGSCSDPSQQFDMYQLQCVSPNTFGHRCPAPTTVAPTTTTQAPSGTDIDVSINIKVSCSYDGQIPIIPDDARPLLDCKTDALCGPGGTFQGLQNVCSKHYRCSLVQGNIRPLVQQCANPTQKYEMTQKMCIVPQTNTCGRSALFYTFGRQNPHGFTQPLPFNPPPVFSNWL